MASATQISTFINKIAPIAVAQAKKHKNQIYASVCIGQACQETGFGTSAKMVKTNGLFGIKVGKSAYHFGTAWKGASYNTKTKEYYNGSSSPTVIRDNFRAYSTTEDSVEDYYDMLCTCKRYKPALNKSTPKECIEAIVSGGYATGPDYAKAIVQIIKTYGLEKYDGKEVKPENPYKLRVSLLKVGSKGESVKWLQYELNRHGANLTVDGLFGKKTELAVVLYQKDHGLSPDGKAGPITLTHLKNNQ